MEQLAPAGQIPALPWTWAATAPWGALSALLGTTGWESKGTGNSTRQHFSSGSSFDMALSGILTEAEIAAGLQSCQAAESFDYKTFFVKVGLNSKSKDELAKVFGIVDQDRSGFIEEEELKLFLKNFSASARALTAAETKAFLVAGDNVGYGKIGVDEFQALVKS